MYIILITPDMLKYFTSTGEIFRQIYFQEPEASENKV